MSFVKKAVKKVFKFAKRLVKNKIFQVVAIIALSVFTAGVAAGGFAAFSGVNSIGAFFTAVGQTMATGAASITGALGFKGASAALAAKGGAAATAAGLAGAPAAAAATGGIAAASEAAVLAPVTSTSVSVGTGAGEAATIAAAQEASVLASVSTTAGTQAGAVAGGGVQSTFGKVMGYKVLGDVTVGQMATSAAMTGFKSALEGSAKNKRFVNGFVAGGLAHGGPEGYRGYTISGGSPDPDPGIDKTDLGEGSSTSSTPMLAQEETYAGKQAKRGLDTGGGIPGQTEGLQGQFAKQYQAQEATPLGEEESARRQGLVAPVQPGRSAAPSPFMDQPTQLRGLV